MSGLLRRLVSESAIYGLGAAASQVVGIVLIPIYARALGTADYGVLAVLNTTISLSSMLAGFALAQAFFRDYLAESISDRDRRRLLAVSLTLRLGLSVIAALVLLILAFPLGTAMLGSDGPGLMLLVVPIVLLDTINVIPLSFLRSERRARTYMLIALLRAVLGSILIVGLVVWAGLGVHGALLGSAIAAAVTTITGLAVLQANGLLRLAWDGTVARSLLTYAAPLVPAAAAGWTLSFADRFLLLGFSGASALGIYSAGYSIGLAINVLVVQPFILMWAPMKWEIYRDDRAAPATFARILTAFVVAAAGVALLLSALSTDIVRLLLTDAFEDARWVVPFSAFAYVLYGTYTLVSTGLTVTSRTGQVAMTVATAAALNLALNVVLIPPFGLMGAAVATLASYLALAVAAGVVGQRHYRIEWQLVRVSAAFGIAFGLALAALLGADHVAWRLACVAAYPALLFGLRVIAPGEVRRLIAPSR